MNPDQLDCKSQLLEFIKNKSDKLFVLTGCAGTGKTYLITKLLQEPLFNKKKIVFTATTNKAVSVLKNMSSEKSNYTDFITIHKLLRIKRIIDSHGIEKFIINIDEPPSHILQKSIFYYDIIIIDEASMINEKLYHELVRISKIIKGKIIFLGDNLQLPPVNEDISKVFNNVDFRLNQVMRNSSNILTLCNRIRDGIKASTLQIKFKNLVGETLSIFKNRDDWIKLYCDQYNEKKNPIVLAYTNKCCEQTNIKIRNRLFNTNEKYIENELIVFNNYYKTKNNNFYTSQQCKIDSVEVVEYKINNIEFSHILNLKYKMSTGSFEEACPIVNPKNIPEDVLCPICYDEKVDELRQPLCGHTFCTVCLKLWLSNKNTCPMCRVKIDTQKNELYIKDNELLSNKINSLKNLLDISIKIWKIKVSGEYVYVIHDSEIENYNTILETIKFTLKDIKSKVDNSHLCEIILVRIWEHVYANLIDNFADISYGYCITTHKSQGSTYPYVFVDSRNILEFNNKNNDGLKCFYTAVSRTAEYLSLFY